MYCMNCGQRVEASGNFCAYCGTPAGAEAARESEGFFEDQERILGAYNGLKTTGFMKMEVWVLVFTDRRLLIARITNAMQKEAAKSVKGYGNKMGAMRALYDPARFYGMQPEEILQLNPENYHVPYEQISQVHYKRIRVHYDHENHQERATQPKLTITWQGEKLAIPMSGLSRDTEGDLITLMQELFPARFVCK